MLLPMLLASAEQGINALLTLDPVSLQRIRALSGQVLHVQASNPDVSLYVVLHADGIQLASHWEAPADCTLTASGSELWQLLQATDKAAALYQPGVSISGAQALLIELADIVQELDIDWEYPLYQWLGPVASGLLSSHLRQRGQRASAGLHSLQLRLQDWLSEEARHLVGRNEAESRFSELDRLKLQLDRLEARTALIQHQLEPDHP